MGEFDLTVESRKLAKLVRQRCKELEISIENLATTIGIGKDRMMSLLLGKKGKVFTRSEVQLLCIFLGIGVDELYPFKIKKSNVEDRFEELKKQGVRVLAGLEGVQNLEKEEDKLEIKRTVIQINHCAQYLRQFPEQ